MKSNLVPILLGAAVLGGGALLLMSVKQGQVLVIDSAKVQSAIEAATAGEPQPANYDLTIWVQYSNKGEGSVSLVEYRAKPSQNQSTIILALVDPMSGELIDQFMTTGLSLEVAAKYFSEAASGYISRGVIVR